MMKVTGQFNDSYAPIADGVASVVRNYAYWLEKKNYCDCYVVTPRFPGYLDHEKFEVLRYNSIPIPLRHPYRAGMATFDLQLRSRLREIKFDLIHAHSPFSAGRLGLKIAREQNIPIVTTFHSKYLDDFKDVVKSDAIARMMLKIIMEFYNDVDEVWTVSNSSVKTLKDYGYKGNIVVVGNGIDLTGGFGAERDKKNDGERLKLLYVGQQIWHKNLRMLVYSLKLLKDSGVGFAMTMVGEGNAQQSLKKLVQRLGMEEDFDFTGKISDREKIKSFYEQADICLLPSVYDTFSMVVREAAAIGCPSVVIKGSCAAENIEDGFNGYLSDNDERSYAKTIMRAASDGEKLKAAGMNAGKTIYRSWESIIDEVAGRYNELISKYRR
jgi:1,2-diacylglycerol 3-alpha-glucosyltransferase